MHLLMYDKPPSRNHDNRQLITNTILASNSITLFFSSTAEKAVFHFDIISSVDF